MAVLDESKVKHYEKVPGKDPKKREKQEPPETYGYGVRHVQALLIFASLTITFIARAHLSVTIVAMTDVPRNIINLTETNVTQTLDNINKDSLIENNRTAITICLNGTFTTLSYHNRSDYENLLSLTEENCEEDKSYNKTATGFYKRNFTKGNLSANEEKEKSGWNVNRTYDWSKSKQEMVLGAFFLGYMIMMTPMGVVVQRWGGKLPLQISLFCSAFLNFFTPWLAVWGDYKAVAVTRIVMGLTQAGTYPSLHALIAKWVPLSERGRLGTYMYTGAQLGTVLSSHVSGLLAVSIFGWPSIYWVTGVLCFIMGVLLTIFGAATPLQHSRITQKEKNYIVGTVQPHVEIRRKTPWKAIFTSKPTWATFLAHVGFSAIYLFVFAQIPTYLHHVVGLDIKSSGLLSSLPYLCNFFTAILVGNICDFCVNKKIASIKTVRIICNTVASFGSSACLIGVSFTTNPAIAVFCLVLCVMMQAGANTGWMMSYIDLAPNFSGTLMATGNTFMNFCACTLPVLVSQVVIDVTDVHQWRLVLFVVSAVACAGNVVYTLFIEAEVQPWNDSSYEPTSQVDPDRLDPDSEELKMSL